MSINKLLNEMKQEQNKSKSEQDWNTFMNALPVDVKAQMDNVAKELNYSSFDQLKGKSPLELSSQDTTNILKAFQKHIDTTKVSFNDLLGAFDAVKEKAGIKTENSNISGILKNLKNKSIDENISLDNKSAVFSGGQLIFDLPSFSSLSKYSGIPLKYKTPDIRKKMEIDSSLNSKIEDRLKVLNKEVNNILNDTEKRLLDLGKKAVIDVDKLLDSVK